MNRQGWADRLIERSVPDGPNGRAILQELREERARRAERDGAPAATRWYRRQALSIWFFSTKDRWFGSQWRSGRKLDDLQAGSGSLRGDLLDGLRVVRRSPGYAASVVLTLGIAMAATISVFTVVRGVLLQDLPYPDAHELVRIDALRDDGQPSQGGMDFPTFVDWTEQLESLEHIAAWQSTEGVYVADGISEVWNGMGTTDGFFAVMGVQPLLGSYPLESDWALGQQSIVLSADVWERRFESDPGIVGRTVHFYEQSWTVIAVMPRDFQYLGDPVDYWIPIRRNKWVESRGTGVFRVVGRVRDGVSTEAASADLQALTLGLREQFPTEIRDVVLRSVSEVQRAPVGRMLWMFLGAVVFFLMVACANVAGLALARTESRKQELSIRRSLGASGGRIARQLMAESVVLAARGGRWVCWERSPA